MYIIRSVQATNQLAVLAVFARDFCANKAGGEGESARVRGGRKIRLRGICGTPTPVSPYNIFLFHRGDRHSARTCSPRASKCIVQCSQRVSLDARLEPRRLRDLGEISLAARLIGSIECSCLPLWNARAESNSRRDGRWVEESA
jgi:hypothetical protein